MIYSFYFSDLDASKQWELQEDVMGQLIEMAKDETEERYIDRPQHKGKSWEQVYTEEYALDYGDWDELTDDEKKAYNWKFCLEEHFRDQALNILQVQLKAVEIEIQL